MRSWTISGGWFFIATFVVPGRSTTVRSGTSGDPICRCARALSATASACGLGCASAREGGGELRCAQSAATPMML